MYCQKKLDSYLPLSEQLSADVELRWYRVADGAGLKHGSATYINMERAFFAGVGSTLRAYGALPEGLPTGWESQLLRRKPAISEERFQQLKEEDASRPTG